MDERDREERFEKWLEKMVWLSLVIVSAIVAGVLFSPWEVSKESAVLIGIIANVGSACFGARMTLARKS